MNDVTAELLSRYADGEVTADERSQVEQLLASDPAAATLLEDFTDLDELFAPSQADPVSDELSEKLYALGRKQPLEAFQPAPMTAGGGRPWTGRLLAAAAAILAVIGIFQLTYRHPLEVTGYTRQVLDANGRVIKTERLGSVRMAVGETLTSKAGERVSAWLPGGNMVVLVGDAEIELLDPREREIFEVRRGTALCTVAEEKEPLSVLAAGYTISADRAYFGVRVRAAGARPAGASFSTAEAEVTVAVSRGSLTVQEDGMREKLAAGERVVFRNGAPAVRTQAWRDPIYAHLLRSFRVGAIEVVPGYFEGEAGVLSVPASSWARADDGRRVLTLSPDKHAGAVHYLVMYARASKPTRLNVTRVRPFQNSSTAETTTVQTGEVGTDWTVVFVPKAAFDKVPETERGERKIPAGRSGLMRLELHPAIADVTFELKSSVWAARPPADHSEEVR